MKAIRTILTIAIFTAAAVMATAQDYPEEYLGLPGDNLNLYAVMDLFQESETLEKFEQRLNDKEFTINNLDLNGDNLVDYITVSDYVDGNLHTIVLRTALNRNEQQDIAVFVVEKLRNGEVQVQLIGDEALYGPDYIVEPIYAETPNPGYRGKTYTRNVNVVTTTYYDIAAWPMIRYMYSPRYVVWRSSWNWGYYPTYWRPWSPHYWHYYYGYHSHWNDHYYRHYRHWDHYRCNAYRTHYHDHMRVYSPTVVVNVNKGHYRTTYSRPDRRSAGEQYYIRTASTRAKRSNTTVSGQRTDNRSSAMRSGEGVTRTSSGSKSGSRSSVNTNRQNPYVVRGKTASRPNTSRATDARNSRQNSGSDARSSSQRSSSATGRTTVQRSTNRRTTESAGTSTQRRSNASSVQSNDRSSKRSSVQARSPQNSSRSSVSRSSGRSSSPSARSSSNSSGTRTSVSRSSSKRSTPSARSSSQSSSSRSSMRGSSSRGSSKASASKSSRSSSPSVSRSSSSSRGSGSMQRSSSGSRSSARSSGSRSSRSSSNRSSRR